MAAIYNRGVALYQRQEKDKACTDWQEAASLGFKQANAVINEYFIEHVMPTFYVIQQRIQYLTKYVLIFPVDNPP